MIAAIVTLTSTVNIPRAIIRRVATRASRLLFTRGPVFAAT